MFHVDKFFTRYATRPLSAKTLKRRRIVDDLVHATVLILSLLLIIYISYDTFMNIPFLENHEYMTFQFWVCIVFLTDFFLELIFADNKWHYLRSRWFFFLISIPYLNLINYYGILLPEEALYYLRFIPLIRGAYSLALVMGYVSHNRAVSLLWQYVAILCASVYMLALLFYYEEHGINPNVHDFWDALYFAAMNTSTVGCYFSAMTSVGKIISVICPTLGMLMLPIFTVYVTSWIQKIDAAAKEINREAQKKAMAANTTATDVSSDKNSGSV